MTVEVIEDLRLFRNFLFVVWRHLGLPDPTPVQYDIADYLQEGPRRKIIEAFRGVGKSFITGAYVAWRLYLNPQDKFLVVSASKDRSDAFSIFVKRLIQEMPLLQHLRPTDDQRDSNISFDVGPATNDQSPSVKSVGITGQLTGSRANEIIADDVESLNNSATHDQRQKLGERIKEFDAVLKPNGRVTYLGTPQTEFTLYKELENRGYTCRIWPALVPSQAQRASYGERLAPYVVALEEPEGAPVDPLRFTEIDLMERKASYGNSGFALQFMLDTTLADQDRYPLKLKDLAIMALPGDMAPAKTVWCSEPEQAYKDLPLIGLDGDRFYRPMDTQKPWGDFTGAVMTIDPSGRGKDETAYAVVKIRNGQLYLTASGGFAGGYEPATLQSLAIVACKQQVTLVVIEDNFGDGMFAELFKPVLWKVWECGVEAIHSTGQKERRIIDSLEPIMNQHRLIVDEKVVRQDYRDGDDPKKSLFYQMTRLTKDRGSLSKDDRIEALGMAVRYWTESMAKDVDLAVKESTNEALDQDLEAFMDLCTKGATKDETYHIVRT